MKLKSSFDVPKKLSLSNLLPQNQSKLLIPLLFIQFLILALAAVGTFWLKSIESPSIASQKLDNNSPLHQQVVRDYFLAINEGIRQGNLKSAWQLMSAKYQLEDSEGNYIKFNTWWQKLQQVEIQQITRTNLNTSVPQIDTKVFYYFKDGRICPDYVRFSLVWNAQKKLWLLDSRDRLLPNGKFICF